MRGPSLAIVGVYAILDLPYRYAIAPRSIVEALIAGGARVIQLRAKQVEAGERRRVLEAIGEPCRAAGVPLIVNDDLELAEAGLPGVAGIHLGQDDLHRLGAELPARRRRRALLRERGLILGVSTHSLDQLRNAVRELAPDYLGFGPVFETTGKIDPDPVVGLEALIRACRESPVPIVAIGGVDSTHAGDLAQSGAAAIAAIGALTGETVDIVRARTFALVGAFEAAAT